MARTAFVPVLLVLSLLTGCRSALHDAYFDAREKLGTPRRALLVDRIEAARDSQQEAQETFTSALDAFQSVTGYRGGDLEALYRDLDAAYTRSTARADEVRARIEAVEAVASSLFREWEDELGAYEDERLRRQSEAQLRASRRQYQALAAKMARVEASMTPVLEAFEDRVLFLKHNLNARAVASLEETAGALRTDVRGLLRDMEASIAEADAYIREMQRG